MVQNLIPIILNEPEYACLGRLDYVLKNKNSSNFTRDANWPPNHKTYFGFALPCLWNVIIHFLIWCGWLGSGQIGRFLTGIITFHRPGRAKCKKCFVVRESMCISGEIRGIFGFSKRNLGYIQVPWSKYYNIRRFIWWNEYNFFDADYLLCGFPFPKMIFAHICENHIADPLTFSALSIPWNCQRKNLNDT